MEPHSHDPVREQDEIYCRKCGKRWGVDEDAPECTPHHHKEPMKCRTQKKK